jgi:hypothetical protein
MECIYKSGGQAGLAKSEKMDAPGRQPVELLRVNPPCEPSPNNYLIMRFSGVRQSRKKKRWPKAGAPSSNIGESMLQGQSYQWQSSEGTNIISFAYLFSRYLDNNAQTVTRPSALTLYPVYQKDFVIAYLISYSFLLGLIR